MSAAPDGRGWGHYLVGILLNVAVFLAIGPIVGAFVFVVLLVAWEVGANGAIQAALFGSLMFVVALPYTLAGAYLMGSLAAASTGVVVAVVSSWVTNARILYASAVVAGGLLSVLCLWLQLRLASGDAAIVPVAFVVGCAAAGVCTRIARPFRLSKPEPAPASPIM